MNMLFRITESAEVVSAQGAKPPSAFSTATEGVKEQIGTLRQAQDAVRSEIGRLARVQPLDQAALRQLGAAVHGFADQAEALIMRMVSGGGAVVLIALVEEIFDSFRDAERQIEIVLKKGRR